MIMHPKKKHETKFIEDECLYFYNTNCESTIYGWIRRYWIDMTLLQKWKRNILTIHTGTIYNRNTSQMDLLHWLSYFLTICEIVMLIWLIMNTCHNQWKSFRFRVIGWDRCILHVIHRKCMTNSLKLANSN